MANTEDSCAAERAFTPALGYSGLTRTYDFAIRLLTREAVWRSALLAQVAPRRSEIILDVGCGTGSFAIMLKRAAPDARVIGLDPDPEALRIAAEKAQHAGVAIEWHRGFAKDAAVFGESIDKAVSSLVFHQIPLAGKRAGIAALFSAVRPGGEVHIADYATQPTRLMRGLFRQTVQRIDGVTDTQPNVDGALEAILSDLARLDLVSPVQVVRTFTGAISLYRVAKQA